MRFLSISILFLLPFQSSAQLSCHRIPISFCCTSRIRDQCPQQCANVQCGEEFIHSLFSIDGSPKAAAQARDGNANIGAPTRSGSASEVIPDSGSEFSFTSVVKPDSVVPNSGDARIHPTTPASSSISASNFPTLIPSSGGAWEATTPQVIAGPPASVPPLDAFGSITPSNSKPRNGHRRRTTPDPRIIRPPESLVVIGDYDEDEPPSENAVVDSQIPVSTFTPPPMPPPPTRVQPSDSSASVSPTFSSGDPTVGTGGSFFRSRKEIVGTEEQNQNQRGEVLNSGTASSTGSGISSGEWKVSLIPRGQIQSPSPAVKSIPVFTIDGKSDERFNKFYRTIDKVIHKLELTPSGNLHVRGETVNPDEGSVPQTQTKAEGRSTDPNVDSSAVIIVSRTTVAPGSTNKVNVLPFRPIHFTSPPPQPPSVFINPTQPSSTSSQCGVAPEYSPCVSTEVASRSLLECCQRKNLPIGCQSLCRYDITQAEIRAAMDRGQCGIFNVAPFLECASQGKDNSECCKHRGIIQKTGPQCEQFCRPAQGLSALGIQHIVCGNAVGDMLHCHHSGVRN